MCFLLRVWECANGDWVAEVSHTDVACLHDWSSPKEPGHQGSQSNCLHVLSHIVGGKLSMSTQFHWERYMDAWTWFLLDFVPCAFLFTDFNLYSFILINHNHEYNIFLWVPHPSSESFSLNEVLWTSNIIVNKCEVSKWLSTVGHILIEKTLSTGA